MNTTASFLPETSWSRRCSTETVFSIQGRETDFVQDSSDSDWRSGEDEDNEYEPAPMFEEEDAISVETSGSDGELQSIKVTSVSGDEGDLQLADSSAQESAASESEPDLPQYRACARCHRPNDDERYMYCDSCFKVRKDLFPPRPRRKGRHDKALSENASQDSGIESIASQATISDNCSQGTSILDNCSQGTSISDICSQGTSISDICSQGTSTTDMASQGTSTSDMFSQGSSSQEVSPGSVTSGDTSSDGRETRLGKAKRRSVSADRAGKRARVGSDTEPEVKVAPLVKAVSDPAVTVETLEGQPKDNTCIICLSEPKSGVFVHRRVAHICCCYNCALKVWAKARRCPICNCKVSNVLKAVVM